MTFIQIVEFGTGRIDELNSFFDAWIVRTERQRIPHRAILQADRDAPNRYVLTVEFPSREQGMLNSARPQTAEFAAFLSDIADGPLGFRNFDVLRDDRL